jgi:hypothetical protein
MTLRVKSKVLTLACVARNSPNSSFGLKCFIGCFYSKLIYYTFIFC